MFACAKDKIFLNKLDICKFGHGADFKNYKAFQEMCLFVVRSFYAKKASETHKMRYELIEIYGPIVCIDTLCTQRGNTFFPKWDFT